MRGTMQDRYVGDVGDYAKYALLKALAGDPSSTKIRLGVVWCRFPDESHNQDGKHIAYLEKDEWARSRFRDIRCPPGHHRPREPLDGGRGDARSRPDPRYHLFRHIPLPIDSTWPW